MGYSRVLLVRPSVRTFGSALPVGAGIISEILGEKAIEHEVMDMNLGYKAKDLMAKIAEFRPDLIGISMLSVMYKETYALIRKIKKLFPNADIVVGGPHVSILREDVLRECEPIDFGVVREGEEIIVELCGGKNCKEIKGLIYRNGGEIVYTGDRNLITNLDNFPFPKYKKFEISKYIKAIPVYSSRGCPYSCIFCSVHDVIGKGFRAKTAEYVIYELSYWYSKGYRRMFFVDDSFTQDLDRIFRLCELIKKEKMDDLILACTDVRADKINKSLLKAMWEVGFREVDLGVEAGSNRILKTIKKGVTIERIEGSIKDACDLGYDVQLFFQVGFPGQTISDIEDSVQLALKYPIKRAYFFNPVPTPNTELFKWVAENSRLLEKPEEYMNGAFHAKNHPLFETTDFSLAERKRMLAYTSEISVLTLKNYYLRKFKKYGLLGKLVVSLVVNKTYLRFRDGRFMWNLVFWIKDHILHSTLKT